MRKNESKALQEVWQWKDESYEEVKHLPTDQAVRKRLTDSIRSVRVLGLRMTKKKAKLRSYSENG